jgi:phosphate-selective porin OprO/OprP
LALSITTCCGLGVAGAQAQQPQYGPPAIQQDGPTVAELMARIDAQQTKMDQLQAQVLGMQAAANSPDRIQATPVSMDSAAAPAASAPVANECVPVGSDMTAKVDFRNGGSFLYFATPDNSFTMHLGGWLQWDNVWWDQSQLLKTSQGARSGPASSGVASGANQGGIGELNDGEFFRRLRLVTEGTFWEQGVYRINWAFENDQFSTVGLDEVWFGAQELPVIGEVHLGHVKEPMGLEGDMSSSSRCMTFMERSSYSEAIELNQNFCTGLWVGNNYDERITWQSAIFRVDNKQATGAFFGDGQCGVQNRLTALPYYCDDGRELLHLGVSGGFRTGNSNNATSPDRLMELAARPELRDDDPAAGGPGVIPNSNSNKMIDTGAIAANGEYLMGTEALWIAGPFSVQGEFGWNFVNGAYGIAPTGTTNNPTITPKQNYVFEGGYLQLAYTLTGENRAYDRKYGTLDRYYYGKSGPFTRFFLTRDADGNIIDGWGAWEIAARYSHTDLNDGPLGSSTRIQGGVMDGYSLALNWYANNNFDMMFDYVFDNRYDLPTGSNPGWTSGFGVEAQLTF